MDFVNASAGGAGTACSAGSEFDSDKPRQRGRLMSRIVRILAFVLGAIWFFPISCITGLIAGTSLLVNLDQRHMEKGDQPHASFFVVWQPGQEGAPFGYSRLAEISANKGPAPARSFLMTAPSARIGRDEFTGIAYKVLSSGAAEQLIEVAGADGDTDSVSRYRATLSGVTPVFSRVAGREHMFRAFPIALAFASAIYAVGWWLRRRVARTKRNDAAINPD
jgi:hypothetical protein